jgi:uncharacterized protein YigE (DUF2233 family)/multisubunit Na+/H+ antiporter MnhB subunit
VFAIIGVGAVLGLLSLCVLCFATSRWKRHHSWVLRVQEVLIAVLSLLLLSEQVIVIQHLLAIVAMAVDSGMAKVSLALEVHGETLQFLGKQGSWAITAAVLVFFLAYAARTSQGASSPKLRLPSHVVFAALSGACAVAANLLFGAALRRFGFHVVEFFNAWKHDNSIVSQALVAELMRAYFAAIGCILVAALMFWMAEKRRPRMARPPHWARLCRRVVTALCLLLAVVLSTFTRPLARELESRIPVDHAFANLTLFPPALGYLQGTGPDATYNNGWAMRLGIRQAGRHILPEAKSPAELYNQLRTQAKLRRQLARRAESDETNLDVSIDPGLSPQQVREWLASLYWGDRIEHIALVISDVVRLDRPVLGKITGAKWTAARFEIRAHANKCAEVRGPTFDLTWPSSETTQAILQRIVRARREGQIACVTVGDRACLSDEPRRPDCLDRLATPLVIRRSSEPGDTLRALRVAWGTAEFDVVEVNDPRSIKLFSDGARTLPELRRNLEKRHCTVHLTMNAGMFEPSYAPVGLFVRNGQVLRTLNESDGEGNFYMKPNGVFSVSRSGARVESSFETHGLYASLRVGTSNDFDAREGWNATQSGPIVLMAGREHPAFDPHSNHRFIRNAVGVREKNDDGEPSRVLLAISNTPVTFHELAQLFTAFDCADALYLDGNVSRMDFPAFGRTVDDKKLGPMLAVAECPD